MADPGSVSYLFSRKGVIIVPKAEGTTEDSLLDAVLERVLELYREQNQIALATVTSAAALSDEQKQTTLEEKTAKFEQSLDSIQDPKLRDAIADLGGSLLLTVAGFATVAALRH